MDVMQNRNMGSPSLSIPENKSYFDALINMGFHSQQVMKALAATGYHGISQAFDWLLSHDSDPTIEEMTFREYYIYLIPTGELSHQLNQFGTVSKQTCGWNGAHDYLPHITLIPPFKAPDKKAPEVIKALLTVMKLHEFQFSDVKLETYVSENYMGFFVKNDSTQYLTFLAEHIVDALLAQGIVVEDGNLCLKKPFHLTLAYKFHYSDFSVLKSLLESLVDPSIDCLWKLNIYARDTRFTSYKVYKVIKSLKPIGDNILELQLGDFIFIQEPPLNHSDNKLVEGTSWLTGLTGKLPISYTERTAVTETWTQFKLSEDACHCQFADSLLVDENHVIEEVVSDEVLQNQELYIMRHGERMDFTFGKWIPYCFDQDGRYSRKDLNMPKALPKRIGGYQAFAQDSPLTTIGEMQARLTGEAMKENGIKIGHIFVSPSLRCVQTGHNVLCGLGVADKLKMKIEPGLFEWLNWYPDFLPDWMTEVELDACGYNIDIKYNPIISRRQLNGKLENLEELYNRGYHIISTILRRKKYSGGNILLIGHSLTLDVCSRQLVGKQPRTSSEVNKLLLNIPYCSLLCLYQTESNTWLIKDSQVPSMTHSHNLRFDSSTLLS